MLFRSVASMEDPTRTHEFAWDEQLLDLAMQEVKKMQDKLAAPIPKILKPEMDKLDFWIIGPYAMLGVSLSHSSSSFCLLFCCITWVPYYCLLAFFIDRIHGSFEFSSE